MKMDISPINAFVNSEVKRYAEMLACNFDNVSVTCSERKDKDGYNYIFHSSELCHDLVFTILDNGIAEFWKRRTFWRWRKNETSVTIAEWNCFADPFEIAISIQLRMYHTLSYYLLGVNNYHENYKDIYSDDDYMLSLPEDEGSKDDYDEPECEKIGDFPHEHIPLDPVKIEPAEISPEDRLLIEKPLKPPYIDVTEVDYLQEFGL